MVTIDMPMNPLSICSIREVIYDRRGSHHLYKVWVMALWKNLLWALGATESPLYPGEGCCAPTPWSLLKPPSFEQPQLATRGFCLPNRCSLWLPPQGSSILPQKKPQTNDVPW